MVPHKKYMQRCLQLAAYGLGNTAPNPMVGAVIVYHGKIIGEGWHQKSGAPHAEVNAINSVLDKNLLKKATLYVSLEPCSHFGKTPPCSDLIIAKGIKKIVVAKVDPNPEVAGTGIKKLLDAGCEVLVGILEKESINLNKRFFTFHQKKRPYIILKWAQTQNGFIAPKNQEKRQPVWITNKNLQQASHKWRTEEAAILVGTNTALKDNPSLTARNWQGNNPVRIVIDRTLKIPENSHLLDGSTPTIILCENSKNSMENLRYEQLDFDNNLPEQICEILYKLQLQSVIIEGGRMTLQSFIDANLWDETRVLTGNIQFNEGINAPKFLGKMVLNENIEGDQLRIFHND